MSRQDSLVKTVEVQKEQLLRYEARLKDLVKAYKSLNREKEALETSLKALSGKKSCTTGKTGKEDNGDTTSNENDSEEKNSTSQLATVTAAMQTLLSEKASIQASYIADKKAMKMDLDQTQKELRTTTQQLTEATEKLARCQRDRDEEVTSCNSMLKESQEVVCREREVASRLHSKLADLEAELADRQARDASAQEIRSNADTWQAVIAEQAQTMADREERTRSLEDHIAELSASLGRHQQQAVADRATIHRLRDQVARLEEEQTTSDVISTVLTTPPPPASDSSDDIEGKAWKHEYRQLKDEFEKYKQRVIADRNKDSEPAGQTRPTQSVTVLEQQRDQLRAKLRKTCEERDDLERSLRGHINRMEKAEAELRLAHRSEVAALEASQRLQLQERDQQLAGQRVRTAALLDEKEAELNQLRQHQPAAAAAAAAAAAQLAELGLHKQEGHMLHYAQEAARKDKEISNLRRTKHQLESAMRQLQNKMLEREQRVQESEQALQQRLTRLELNASREGANLEYIKNIVVRYLVTKDSAQRAHILNAISTALRFSVDELRRVRQGQPAAWWPAAATTASHGGH